MLDCYICMTLLEGRLPLTSTFCRSSVLQYFWRIQFNQCHFVQFQDTFHHRFVIQEWCSTTRSCNTTRCEEHQAWASEGRDKYPGNYIPLLIIEILFWKKKKVLRIYPHQQVLCQHASLQQRYLCTRLIQVSQRWNLLCLPPKLST